jgi:hypothetical protein
LLKNINKRSIETTIEKSDIVVTKRTKLIRKYSETYLEYGFIDGGKTLTKIVPNIDMLCNKK